MAGFGAREARINQERKPRVNLCSCGEEIDSTELLCHTCYMEVHGYGRDEVCQVETTGYVERHLSTLQTGPS